MSKLARACEMSLDDWFATFPDVIPEAEFSKKHEKWKANLFNKMRDGYYHRFTTKTVKVIWVAAVLLTLLLTAFVIPSSREFVLEQFDKFSTYQLTETNDNSIVGEIKVGYIPEGYKFDYAEYYSKGVLFKYKLINGDFFNIMKCSSSMKMEFDTENFLTEEIIVDDIKYIYCTGNVEMNSVIWHKNDYVYQIDAPFEKQELLKIAKSVD